MEPWISISHRHFIETTQYNVDCGAGEPTKEEHPCYKERQGICVVIRQKNLVFAGVPKGLFI